MTGHAVVIAGGGPTGLMLAGELALAGVDVAIVERRESQDLDGLRAGRLHIRIRPDGYVAWVGDRTQPGLGDALTTWAGPGRGNVAHRLPTSFCPEYQKTCSKR
jgi:thioredoxin reductase